MRFFKLSMTLVAIFAAFLMVACGPKASEKIIGKWGIDVEKLMQSDKMKAIPEAERKAAEEMAKGMASSVTIEFTKDKVIADMMGKKDEATYKVLAETADSVDLETTKDGKAEKTTIKIVGDTLEMDMKGEKMTLKKK